MDDLYVLPIEDWMVLVRQPEGFRKLPVFLLLHGWTGDENSMGIFATRLPRQAILVAPRGLFATPLGGFSWQSQQETKWSRIADFEPALARLVELLSSRYLPKADFSRIHLVGFSQGAALAFTFALKHPDLIHSVAGLSGFMPDDAGDFVHKKLLAGKRFFLAHGTRDELVPVTKARQAIDVLERAGAVITYCEDDVGHKLSASCFRGLEAFFHGQANLSEPEPDSQ